MIFAAGKGTRMAPLTHDRPKPLIKVAGKTLLDHALDPARAVKFEKIVVNCHYHGDQIQHHLEGSDVIISDETGQLLETGGGLKNALPILGNGPVATMNSDAVWDGPNPYDVLKSAWSPDYMDCILLVVEPNHALGHLGGGWAFHMHPSGQLETGGDLIYTGAQITKTDDLKHIIEPHFSMRSLWEMQLSKKKIFGVKYTGRWCDVGQPASIQIAEDMVGYSDV